MANSKNGRKVLAASVSAAVVASVVAPAVSAATLNDFDSVPSWAQDAVKYLADNDYIKGDQNGNFNPADTIDRASAAEILKNVQGLTASGTEAFDDVDSSDWFYNAVLATSPEIFKGDGAGKFLPGKELSRQEAAVAIAAAFDLSGTATLSFDDVSDIATWATDAVEAAVANDVITGKPGNEFAPTDNISRAEFAVMIKRAIDATATPEVVSVSAINLKQVAFKFSKKVDADTAEDVTNYFKDNAALVDGTDSAELQADGKTVIVTLNTQLTDGNSYTFKADGVTDEAGTEVAANTFAVTASDTTAPTVESVAYTGGKVVVTFDEYLDTTVPTTALTFRVNGQPVTPAYGADGKSVEATVTLAASTNASVYLAKVEDLNSNEMALYSTTFATPGADTEKPHVTSLKQVAQNVLRITLSEAVSGGNDLVTGEVKLLQGATVYENGVNNVGLTVAANTTVDPTGKTYDLTIDMDTVDTTSDNIFTGTSTSETFTLLLDSAAIADAAGNENNAYTTSFTLNKDTAGPAFASSKVTDNKQQFQLTFNEDLTLNSTTGIIVTDTDGVRYDVVAGAGETEVNGTDNKVLNLDIITGTGTLADGTYTIYLPDGALEDSLGNTSSAITTNVVVSSAADAGKPTATVTNTGGNENLFTVTYSEPVSSSALNLNNYRLDGGSLPAGTQIYFTDTTKTVVEIILPANSVNFGVVGTGTNAILTVSNVADASGNVMNSTSQTVRVEDNTAAVLQGAQILGDTIELTFNEDLGALTATDISALLAQFEIKGGSTVLADGTTDAVSTTVNGSKVTFAITAGDSNWNAVKAASTLTITTDSPTLTDANGAIVKDGVSVTVSN